MQHAPLRVVMSRDGSDGDQEALRDVHGVMVHDPHVGEPVKIFLDNGRYLTTSVVKRVAEAGDELIVETANSTYRLHPDTN